MNRLIIVEGLPCSGKSTASKYIADRLGAAFFDEGSGSHPADYEFHAFVKADELCAFSADEQKLVKASSLQELGGYIVPLGSFESELFDKLLKFKIYDFLPWETEKPVMLSKWQSFAKSVLPDERYVFNCVLLQNPMCETMLRFGFDTDVSREYIKSICDIIRPLEPLIIYLDIDDIRSRINKTVPERGRKWLECVIDYHCSGAYGKANSLKGFDGYISALQERRRREIEILKGLDTEYQIIKTPDKTLDEIIYRLK